MLLFLWFLSFSVSHGLLTHGLVLLLPDWISHRALNKSHPEVSYLRVFLTTESLNKIKTNIIEMLFAYLHRPDMIKFQNEGRYYINKKIYIYTHSIFSYLKNIKITYFSASVKANECYVA